MARKICIYTAEEVKCLSLKIKHLVSEEAGPEVPILVRNQETVLVQDFS